MPDSTLRYFAASRVVYARALLELVTYARGHAEDFSIGPPDISALEHQDLAVSGPDLAGVQILLDGIPGLSQEQLSLLAGNLLRASEVKAPRSVSV